MLHFYRCSGLVDDKTSALLARVSPLVPGLIDVQMEYCFNVATASPPAAEDRQKLVWLLAETFEPHLFAEHSLLPVRGLAEEAIVEVVEFRFDFLKRTYVSCVQGWSAHELLHRLVDQRRRHLSRVRSV